MRQMGILAHALSNRPHRIMELSQGDVCQRPFGFLHDHGRVPIDMFCCPDKGSPDSGLLSIPRRTGKGDSLLKLLKVLELEILRNYPHR